LGVISRRAKRSGPVGYPNSGYTGTGFHNALVEAGRYRAFRLALKRARVDAELTQVQLAGRLKKPQSFVSKYETGERQLDVLEFVEVAQALRLDAPDFLRRILKQDIVRA
jgi:hypothetical protein